MADATIDQAFAQAVQHHQAGRLADAEQIYCSILAKNPAHAQAMHLLGVIALQAGRYDVAVEIIRKAIALKPDYAEAHGNLGSALVNAGRVDEAIAAYRKSIALDANSPGVHNNLGNILNKNGNLPEAIAVYRQAIALLPNYAEAYNNMGIALWNAGAADEAIAACRKAIELRPGYAESFNNLGIALCGNGQFDEAIAAHRQAIALNPQYAEAYYNLSIVLKGRDKVNEAISACQQAIALNPKHAEAHYNLGVMLKRTFRLDEAIAAYEQAVALNPGFADAHNNLGIARKDQGRLDDALACYRTALKLNPNLVTAHSNIVYTAWFHPDYDPPAILREARQWARQQTQGVRRRTHHANDRDPDRQLKIGYVSPDFFEHPVGRFLLPLLANHDPKNFEIYCYDSGFRKPDQLTQRLRQASHLWRNVAAMNDEELAGQIRQDGIDILVELALHTANNRLLAFARKPAPVQVTYLGYCGTTGLDEIDYRLSDPYLDPPDAGDENYSEKTVRLRGCYWCYIPMDDSPGVSALPARANGVITFGCFNNFCKINEPTIGCWVSLMQSLPASRLILHAHEGEHRQKLLQTFARAGIGGSRVSFVGHLSGRAYLEQYRQVDIALDPFPYGGGTTTCDALWMGVPVITLAGKTPVGRGGVTLLSHLGLTQWIAQSPAEYVAIGRKWAEDFSALAALRGKLREMMTASPIMDAKHFAADVEAAYRTMWRAWANDGT